MMWNVELATQHSIFFTEKIDGSLRNAIQTSGSLYFNLCVVAFGQLVDCGILNVNVFRSLLAWFWEKVTNSCWVFKISHGTVYYHCIQYTRYKFHWKFLTLRYCTFVRTSSSKIIYSFVFTCLKYKQKHLFKLKIGWTSTILTLKTIRNRQYFNNYLHYTEI